MDLSQLRTIFIKEHNIRFKSFCCNEDFIKNINSKHLFSHLDPEPENYGVADNDEWILSNSKCRYPNPKIIIQYKGWLGCLCNPQKFDHVCSAYYESTSGWNLTKIIAAARHHYIWSCVSAYFTKQQWTESLSNANINDLIGESMTNNQIGKDIYLSNIMVSYSPKDELVVTYYPHK